MANRTVVIIKEGEGEYDSYVEYPTDVYIVPRKKFNAELEYHKYFFAKIKERTQIPIEWRKTDHSEGIYYPKQIKGAEAKLLKQIATEYDIKHFLEIECKAKRVDFSEYMK
jgi:hypothetical protein